MEKPDYKKLREQKKFNWYVAIGGSSLWTLTGIPVKDFYTNPNACIEAYRKGRHLLRELFGPDVGPAPVSTPMIKYGHLNTLGAQLTFPQEGEPHHKFAFESAEQGIKHLQREVDFATAGMTPFYLDFYEKMQHAFPDERVYFGWQWEGPITTTWGLLGESFMYDLFDRPDTVRRLLKLAAASIVEFCRFFCKVENTAVLDSEPDHGKLCDDIAAMIPARMWENFVLPYWDMYYNGPAPGRIVHCEDMNAEQLQFLESISIIDYDPGISPKLSPKIINAATPVPFGWRLAGFGYSSMSCRDVEDFVYQAVADGASYVFTFIEAVMCNEITAEKVQAFITTAREVQKLLNEGATRKEIGRRVSAHGRENFWGRWLR